MFSLDRTKLRNMGMMYGLCLAITAPAASASNQDISLPELGHEPVTAGARAPTQQPQSILEASTPAQEALPWGPAASPAAPARATPSAKAPQYFAPDALSITDAGAATEPEIFELPPAGKARLTTLVPPKQLGISENAVFNSEGRFFVAGGDGIYEIVRGEEPDTYAAVLFAPNPGCSFGGLTARGARLYAPCTNSVSFTGELIVFDPARSQPLVSRAAIVTESIAHFNGMAFGPDGALYLSNSLALDSVDPAVVRLEILEEEPLRFMQSAFIAASRSDGPADAGGGTTPNGIRFHEQTMFLVRGPDVVAVPVDLASPDAALSVVYTAQGTLPTIDDFDIGDGRMWLTEFGALSLLGVPGESRLVVTDLEGDRQFAMDLPFIASSTIVSLDPLFGQPCIIVTSFFDGGLYRVTFE